MKECVTNSRNKRSPFDVCYKYVLAYCKETTLHGLQYAGNPKISFGERYSTVLVLVNKEAS